MKIDIKSRWNSTVLFTAEAASVLLALQAAIKSGANLRGADLRGADLRGANLRGAELCGADLCGANLRGADLYGANLRVANLRVADLYGANLRGADLRGADLYGADLDGANLGGADLRGADLYGANLRGANLRGADLYGADLYGANLYGANLRGAKNSELAIAQTIIAPEGHIVGWKKCQNNVIVKLLIPQDAKRSNASGRKCRASYAKVLRVFGAEEGISVFSDTNTPPLTYRKGEIVKPSSWNEDRWVECSSGIHFYLTRVEAENN